MEGPLDMNNVKVRALPGPSVLLILAVMLTAAPLRAAEIGEELANHA
jgi:hypothetical protein